MKLIFLVPLCSSFAMNVAYANGISAEYSDFDQPILSAPAEPWAVLYDQMDNLGGTGTSSQDFETAHDSYDDQAADDFVVPAGQAWSIDGIDVVGGYYSGSGPADSFNVYFYANAGILPGALLSSRLAQPFGTNANAIIAFSPVILPAGTYWVSVQARMDLVPHGQWAWRNRAVTSNRPSAWKNPGLGLATTAPCPDWAVRINCLSGVEPDMAFRLNGTSTNVTSTFPPDENFDLVAAPALPGGWTTAFSGNGIAWKAVTSTVDTPLNAAFAPNVSGVSDMTLNSPAFVPVAGQTLSFKHNYILESTFDGAVLEISTNGGTVFQDIITAGGSFISGGYNATISSSFNSPIGGRQAWSGNSGGYVATVVRLPAAAIGQPTVLRFRTADDSSVGATGWWLDTVHLGGLAPGDAIFCSGFESGEDGSCIG